MSEALSIIIEMILAFGLVALLLAGDHVLVTRLMAGRAHAGTSGTGLPTVQSYPGRVELGTQGLKPSRMPAGWTVIKGLRDASA